MNSGRATANTWLSHEFKTVALYHSKFAHEEAGERKVVIALTIENMHEYCRASSNLGISIRGSRIKLKLHTCSISIARVPGVNAPPNFMSIP